MTKQKIRELLNRTLELAKVALEKGNYPIGSVVTDEKGEILVEAYNENTTLEDITAHAETLCLRKLGSRAFKDNNEKLVLFTSLEPCYGCSFFLDRTCIKTIHSSLKDPHKGGISNLKSHRIFEKFFQDTTINLEPFEDLKTDSKKLMREYFLQKGRIDAASFYK